MPRYFQMTAEEMRKNNTLVRVKPHLYSGAYSDRIQKATDKVSRYNNESVCLEWDGWFNVDQLEIVNDKSSEVS